MAKKKTAENIKIIAIRPCNGCHKDYIKVLQKNKIYTIYNDYKIDEDTETIIHTPSIPIKLFDQDDLSINISAIAGQNGSGKSTLIELLFMAVNNIGYVNGLHEELELVKELNVELYCLIGELYKIRVNNDDISVFKYKADHTLNSAPEKKYDLNKLFFTIAINYSLYAYNSSEIRSGQKDWLKGLFHKNDSYQTPLVINPWRNRGDINVNNENGLVRLRLMANLLRPVSTQGFNFRKVSDNLTAVKLRLTVNPLKSRQVLYEIPGPNKKELKGITLADLPKIDKHTILSKINKLYPFKYKKAETERENSATNYLIGKLVSVAVTYSEYKDKRYYSIEDENFDMERIDEFLIAILDDPSHIAFKIKQTLNFLKYPYLTYENRDVDIVELSDGIGDIIKNTRGIKPKVEELIPPPIFRVDILLAPESELETKDFIFFQTLSSGERQMIYSISSLIYHLINLDSVTRRGGKVKYTYINIILEEVELYFHPEMQRGFVRKLLDNIRNIQLQSIKAINVCFVTHSPFILSDIPDANVMFLKVENKISKVVNKEEKTFGAISTICLQTDFLCTMVWLVNLLRKRLMKPFVS